MEPLLFLKAALLGLVEGLTEFLPISSTGHLIVAGSLLNFVGEQANVFKIAIQTGAMLAVLVEYRNRFMHTLCGIGHQPVAQRFARNVLWAFFPAVVLGLFFGQAIEQALFYPVPVAVAFVVGGCIMLLVERRHQRLYGDMDRKGTRLARVPEVDAMTWRDALAVGILQCLALIPGTSRSGATIIGAVAMGFSRKAAAEFSFFLGVPTLMGAGAWALYKHRHQLHMHDMPIFLVGTVAAAISAWWCIRWLIRYVSRHSFIPFAWYRMAFGMLILLTTWMGWVQW